jgi:hypothetical protein
VLLLQQRLCWQPARLPSCCQQRWGAPRICHSAALLRQIALACSRLIRAGAGFFSALHWLCWPVLPCLPLSPTLCRWLLWRRTHSRWWGDGGGRRRLVRWAACWWAAALPAVAPSQAVLCWWEDGQAKVLLRLLPACLEWGCPYAALGRWIVPSAAPHFSVEVA